MASVPAVRRKSEPCRSSQGLLSTIPSTTGRPSAYRSAAHSAVIKPPVECALISDPVVAVLAPG